MIYVNDGNLIEQIVKTKNVPGQSDNMFRLFLLDFCRDVTFLRSGTEYETGRCVLMSNYEEFGGNVKDFKTADEAKESDFIFKVKNVFVEPRSDRMMIVDRLEIDITYRRNGITKGDLCGIPRCLFPCIEELMITLNLGDYYPQYVRFEDNDNVRLNFFNRF